MQPNGFSSERISRRKALEVIMTTGAALWLSYGDSSSTDNQEDTNEDYVLYPLPD
jgi:hypothetical protein